MDSFSHFFESDRVAAGECFPYAWRFFKDLVQKGEKDASLVHGLVTNPLDGKTFWHAWVNWNGDVYDWQSGGKRSSYQKFKKIWKPDIKQVYHPDDIASVMIKSARSKHYGPWE